MRDSGCIVMHTLYFGYKDKDLIILFSIGVWKGNIVCGKLII